MAKLRQQDVPFQWDLAVKLAIEAAKAVNALHCWKPSIVHRDLKVPNLHSIRHCVESQMLERFLPEPQPASGRELQRKGG